MSGWLCSPLRFAKFGMARSAVKTFLCTYEYAGLVSDHPRRYYSTNELHFHHLQL